MAIGTSSGKTYDTQFEEIIDQPVQMAGKDLDRRTSTPLPFINPMEAPTVPLNPTTPAYLPRGPIRPGEKLGAKDLDKRTPESLPILPPVHSIAPHNPNPPGGGYEIRPGERLSDETPDAVKPGQQYAANEGKSKTQFSIPGTEIQGPGRGGVGGGYSKGGNVENLIERKQMRNMANENDPGYKQRYEDFLREEEKIFMKSYRKDNIKPVTEDFKPNSYQEFTQRSEQWHREFQKQIDDLKALHPKVGSYAEMFVKDSAQWSPAEKAAFYATVGTVIGGSALVGGMHIMGASDKEKEAK